tara:strand:+ start:411 stop:515 length:105 start_codon:yes stop_codon:yes gene_type:complete
VTLRLKIFLTMKIILGMTCVLVIEWPNEKPGNLL